MERKLGELTERMRFDNDVYRRIVERTKQDLRVDENRLNQLKVKQQTLEKAVLKLEKEVVLVDTRKNEKMRARDDSKEMRRRESMEMHRSISLARKALVMEKRNSIVLERVEEARMETLRDMSRKEILDS